jgi:hypothetical protein
MDGYEDVPKATQEFEKANQKLMHGRHSLALPGTCKIPALTLG